MSAAMLAASAAIVDFLVRGGVDSEGDVLADAVAEQECLLRHKADISCAARQRVIADRDGHRSARFRDRRRRCAGSDSTSVVLPDPVGPTIARLRARGDLQVYVVQNLLAFVVEIEMREIRSRPRISWSWAAGTS